MIALNKEILKSMKKKKKNNEIYTPHMAQTLKHQNMRQTQAFKHNETFQIPGYNKRDLSYRTTPHELSNAMK